MMDINQRLSAPHLSSKSECGTMGEKPFREEYPQITGLLRWVFYMLTCAGVSFAVSGWCHQRGFRAGSKAGVAACVKVIEAIPLPPETAPTEVSEP